MSARTTALLLIALASPASAQRRCKKGIPCGGSCISATKTCRVGSGSSSGSGGSVYSPYTLRSLAPPPPAPAQRRALEAAAARTRIPPNARYLGDGGFAVADPQAPFVAWPAIGVYFAASCEPSHLVPPIDRIYFRSGIDAERAHFVRSPIAGC